jgi:hypothetical protein
MSWRRKWALAGCKMYNKLEYTKAKRLLDRGYDDKDHRTFIDIECNIRFHADFRSGSGLLFQQHYVSAS